MSPVMTQQNNDMRVHLIYGNRSQLKMKQYHDCKLQLLHNFGTSVYKLAETAQQKSNIFSTLY